VNLSESTAEAPTPKTKAGRGESWPVLVRHGSVVVKIYRIKPARLQAGGPVRYLYNVSYNQGAGVKTAQRGTLEKAREFAKFKAEAIASGTPGVAETTQHDLDELAEARRRAGEVPLLLALEEWAKARQLVGGDVVAACSAWSRRQTKFERLSVHDVVTRFREAKAPKPAAADPARRKAKIDNLGKSYEAVFKHFVPKFGDRYIDEIKAKELDEWFRELANAYSRNTRRKRVVTLFRWAAKKGYLPRDLTTEADHTDRAKEEAARRELTTPETLARILFLLHHGIDLEDQDRTAKYEPRPDLVPAVVVAAFCGFRSSEGDLQNWEDLYLELTGA
jgi:hypothetical protein